MVIVSTILLHVSKKRYLYFVCKDLICSCAEISSETNDPDYSRFLDVPPVVYSGCWAGTWRRQLVVVFEAFTSGQKGVPWYVFGQVGGNSGQLGGVDKLSRIAGSYPRPFVVKKGDPFAPFSVVVPLGPRTYSKKKQWACAAWAAGVSPAVRNYIWGRLGHAGTSAVRALCLYPQMAKNPGGIPPFDPFPRNIYRPVPS